MAGVPKIEEKSEEEGVPPHVAAMAVPTSIYQTSTGQYSMYAAPAGPSTRLSLLRYWSAWFWTNVPLSRCIIILSCVGRVCQRNERLGLTAVVDF